jgi:hypothetical protein
LKNQSGSFKREERKLFNQSEFFRRGLIELHPEKYHFGKKNKSYGRSNSNGSPKYSLYGDKGYMACSCCNKLFKPLPDKMEKKLGLQYTHSFSRCKDHENIKYSGTIKAKEAVNELSGN